jgi:pimeloyl-ACP methyl ester carboxylesterase
VSTDEIVDVVEQAMDEAGFAAAHIVGNSLGGYLGLRLAARGRARTVVALAPAGGSAVGDGSSDDTLALFATWQEILREIARDADALMQTALSLRDASSALTTSYEHIPPELLAHHLDAAANCDGMAALIATAHREGYELDAGRVTCPVRIVWGTDDRVLPWPSSAVRYVREWMPDADWVKLAGVGHCPQLDVPGATAELIVAFTSR